MSGLVAWADVETAVNTYLQPILGLEARNFSVDPLAPRDLLYELPVIATVRFGGASEQWVLDKARLDLDVLAGNRALAWDLASRARTAVLGMRNVVVAGGLITQASEISAPTRRAWDNTDLRRYQAAYQLVVKGQAPA